MDEQQDLLRAGDGSRVEVAWPCSDPAGHKCDTCDREATMIWGDLMTVNHGGGEWRCDVCALTERLEFARERAAEVPELERELAEAIQESKRAAERKET